MQETLEQANDSPQERYSGNRKATQDSRAELRRKASEITHDVEDIGHLAADIAKEVLNQFRDNAMNYYERGRQKAGRAEQSVENKIQHHPLFSLVIATCIGLVFGAFLRRSKYATP